jgi:hypothetical protein
MNENSWLVDDDYPRPVYSRDSKKAALLARIGELETQRRTLRLDLAECETERDHIRETAKANALMANANRAAAEMTLRNVKAAVQTLLNFANDQPITGQIYIDPANGEATRVPNGGVP